MTNVVLPQRGWFSLWLPLELRRRPVDVFLGLSQAVPETRAKKIGFVYDLGFLHHPEAYPKSLHRLKHQTRQLVARSDKIITISEVVKADIEKNYAIGNKPVKVCYPGVEQVFKPQGPKYQGESPYFLFVGSLKRSKNIPFLIRAFGHFLKQTGKIYDLLLVGGDYWLDPEIASALKKENISERIKFLGFISDLKLASLYRGALALVSPSLWEGFCLPAAEALSSGTPVIGSTTGAFSEIVGKSGTLVDPQDLKALIRALHAYSQKRKISARKFSWVTIARDILNFYET